MSERKHVRAHLGPTSLGSWVEIDGQRVKNVKSFAANSDVHLGTTVTLELINCEVELEIEEAALLADVTHMASQNREYREIP